MKVLSQIVSELLYDYDCVIIPELGGFITNYRSAYINEDNGVLFPPSKALGFNGNLIQNDGLLANHISSKNNVSFEMACDQIKEQVETCFEELNNGHRVSFEKVGILYLDDEQSIQFEPDESVNYLTSSFGLIQFHYPQLEEHAKPVLVEETRQEEVPEEILETPIIPIQKRTPEKVVPLPEFEPKIRKISGGSRYRYWAAAALIPLLFYVGMVTWQSDVLHGGNIHTSDLNPFKTLKAPAYKERTSVPSEIENFEIELSEKAIEILPDVKENDVVVTEVENTEIIEEKTEKIPENKEEIKTDPIIEVVRPLPLFASPEIASRNFHVMNGCYGVLANAERQAKKLRAKGYDASILDKKGKLYRVSQGSLNDEQEAIELLKIAKREDDASAWLLKK